MKRHPLTQRIITLVLTLSAAALLFASGLPHRHDNSTASHPEQACRVCKMREGFSATPPSPVITHHILPAVTTRAAMVDASPHAIRFVRSASPRAPPVVS